MVYIYEWEKRQSFLGVETLHNGVFLMCQLKITMILQFIERCLYRRIINLIVLRRSYSRIINDLFINLIVRFKIDIYSLHILILVITICNVIKYMQDLSKENGRKLSCSFNWYVKNKYPVHEYIQKYRWVICKLELIMSFGGDCG